MRTRILAEVLGVPPRTARWYAARLETDGLVGRRSPKTGWLPARMVPA